MSTSSPFRSPGAVCTKTGATVAYGLGFGSSLYGWKYNFKTFQMALVAGPNSSGVDGNHLRKLTSRIWPGAALLFFCRWSVYRVGAQEGRVQGSLHDPRVLFNSRHHIVRVWVLLKFILSITVVAVHRFVRPQLVRLIIHLQSHFI